MHWKYTLLRRLSVLAVGFALVVIMLGAWVRLSDAGLGCPDWPACYGHVTWPVQEHEIERATANYPQRPVQVHKAWKEVLHRYFAGTLGIIVLVLAWLTWKLRQQYAQLPVRLALLLVAVIMLQAAFGMWTVTLQLLPWVVTSHLLGGMATVALLFWQSKRIHAADPVYTQQTTVPELRPWVIAALLILLLQIALGGWVSSNYAALACIDLPTCQQQWWPATDFSEGFTIWREIGIDYEGGVLDQAARTAIHVSHRIGALLALIVIGAMALRLWSNPITKSAGIVAGLLLLLQVYLGINNIVLLLPLANAVAHNGVAALLLLAILNALWLTRDSAATGLQHTAAAFSKR